METLIEFREDVQTCLDEFVKYWRENHQKDPEKFPMAMKDGNEGLWWEMFLEFDKKEI
jgi:hypothetical protein